MKIAFIFPGQGSQFIGMLQHLSSESAVISTFKEASDTLGFDLWTLAQQGPKEALNLTENTQPLLLCAGIAVYRLWLEKTGQKPFIMAGHSLGEYTALVASGALQFSEACLLTRQRGRYMQQAVPPQVGAMAAIVGLADDAIAAICERAAKGESVTPANYNALGQVVISGHVAAVRRAMTLAEQEGASLCVELPVSVPSHCALMKPAASQLEIFMRDIALSDTNIPVIHNVDCSYNQTPSQIRALLIAQLYSAVHWVKTILLMQKMGCTHFFECGPGRILTGLNKRIDRTLLSLTLGEADDFQKAIKLIEQPAEGSI